MFFFFLNNPIPEAIGITLIGNSAINAYENQFHQQVSLFQFERNELSKKFDNKFILTEEYPFFGRKYTVEDVSYCFDIAINKKKWDKHIDSKKLNLIVLESSELFSAVVAAKVQDYIDQQEGVCLPILLGPILDNNDNRNGSKSSYIRDIKGEKTYILCSDETKLDDIERICKNAIETHPFYQSAIEASLKDLEGVELIKDANEVI